MASVVARPHWLVFFLLGISSAQLSPDFYSQTCPQVFPVVKWIVYSAIVNETRMGASLLRLFFHDCFVNGCDGSLFLDDTPTFTGEKRATPNLNSARGFEVIDEIKSNIEMVCPGVVSCADIIAIVARDAVTILGGPDWNVKLGRRDSRTASQLAANNSIPPPTSDLDFLVSNFNSVGLSIKDLVALSGAHTIGQARCTNFRDRIYTERDNSEPMFAQVRATNCPRDTGSGDNNLAPLDLQSPTTFDNNYFTNLVNRRGLLHSDQQIYNGGPTDQFVREYYNDPRSFASDFVEAMIKMGDIRPLIGSSGEIRRNCRKIN
ncbi:hypothetical protein DCAR_0313448 [Daucus carota subsp. sativus]|uniref:Peroxidase n=1 Tax=Daucus carota subsp. sativus TaxID=79200 RepID=A0A161Y1W1_DAUCS|nr:PREDICTED: peroxidase 4-like [Daucus carota subsp. sativus]WOG94155.1 hypothetical protein DCAR_0313448 [Daucus carota subsp. sativus]